MAVIGTFSSFTTARLAIYASQASLNVTGNNIANINTKGYTRQRMDLVSLYSYGTAKFANIYNTNIGYGVLTNGASQLRDPFLDIRYRDENSMLEQNSEWLNGLTQMGHVLDEVGKGDDCFGVIEAQLGALKDSLQKLANSESFTEFDRVFRSDAEILTNYFKQSAQDLQSIWNNKAEELDVGISEVNSLLTEIRDLNDKIRTQSIYGDKALELRDARNLALDNLSKYMKIDVTYSMERIDQFTEVEKLTVTIADSKGPDGKPIKLVDGIYAGQISVQKKEPMLNPNYDPVKLYEELEKTRQEADANNPIQNWVDSGWIPNRAAQLRPDIEKANPMADSSPWKEQLKALDRQAEKTGAEEAKKLYTENMTDDEKNAILEQQIAAAKTAMQKDYDAVTADWTAFIDKKATSTATSEAEAQRQQIIEKAVNDKKEELVKTNGKYVKTLADPNANPPVDAEYTNDLYETDPATGLPKMDADGNYVYNVLTYNNDKFLLQVEPLKDERDRLMVDPYTVSKRSEIVELNDTLLTGKLQAIRELLTEEGEYASKQDLGRTDETRLSDDPNAAIKRGIPYYQKALDTLARQIAKQFNEMNQLPPETVYQSTNQTLDADGKITDCTFISSKDPLTAVQTADGQEVSKSRMDNLQEKMDKLKEDMDKLTVYPRNPYMSEEDAAAEIEALQKEWDEANADLLACKQAIQDTGLKDPLYAFYDGGVLFSNAGNNNDPSGITAANISIAIDWAEGPVRVLQTKKPDFYDNDGNVIPSSSRNDNILDMISRYDEQLEYNATDVQPDADVTKPMFNGNFREVFTSISANLGTDAYETGSKVDNYTLMTLDLDNDRLSVSGVDLNEEATSMMQFSKSYAAACKLLTTLDSMLDKLINGTI